MVKIEKCSNIQWLENTLDESNNSSVSTWKYIERNALFNKKLRKCYFIKYEFTNCFVNGKEYPLCVNWKNKLVNKNMKSAKLKDI